MRNAIGQKSDINFGIHQANCEIRLESPETRPARALHISSNFDRFGFSSSLSDLGFTATAGEEKARDILKHGGLGIKANIDQFAVASPEEATHYAALGAEEELDD